MIAKYLLLFLFGLIIGVSAGSAAQRNIVRSAIEEGIGVIDGKAYKITLISPKEDETNERY